MSALIVPALAIGGVYLIYEGLTRKKRSSSSSFSSRKHTSSSNYSSSSLKSRHKLSASSIKRN